MKLLLLFLICIIYISCGGAQCDGGDSVVLNTEGEPVLRRRSPIDDRIRRESGPTRRPVKKAVVKAKSILCDKREVCFINCKEFIDIDYRIIGGDQIYTVPVGASLRSRICGSSSYA